MKLQDNDAKTMPATAMAALIDARYLTDWPHEWTRSGMRSIRRHMVAKRRFDGDAVVKEAVRVIIPGRRNFSSAGVGW